MDSIKLMKNLDKYQELSNLSSLLIQNKTSKAIVKLMNREVTNAVENQKFNSEFDLVQSNTIKYSGGNGEIGLYYEIDENNDPAQDVNVNEVTTSLFPDVEITNAEISETSYNELPVISTSTGKTYVYIKRLNPDTEYKLDILQHKLLTASDDLSTDVSSNVAVKAYLYSADKDVEIQNAKIQINEKVFKLPVFPWMPA